MKKVEVLSPAGSYQSLCAAIHAGADAIYLGGDAFGARAYANNFSKEELLSAIEYAHIYGRKVYLTVNTLLKNEELEKYLYDYLVPYYEAGLDAVIVQDFGVFSFIHEHFPGLHIHASTQMTITGRKSASLLKEMGASRVVTARELSAEELADIHKNVDIEIESFVHGALCYCYSGQCLLSSFIGGRSGNRGRCAQPCRLPYQVTDEQNQTRQHSEKEKYVLSPKDMCALEILPDVIDAGVYSLKIEGRMKNSEYTAGVVSLYRKYVDMYLQKGRKGYHVLPEDIHHLKDLYNRGGFTEGYYKEHNGRDMMALTRPNNCGTKALKVLENKKGCLTCRVMEEIFPGDMFEINADFSITNKNHQMPGETYTVNIPYKHRVVVGQELNRTRNQDLVTEIRESYLEKEPKILVDGKLVLTVGQPARLELTHTAQRDIDKTQSGQLSGQNLVCFEEAPCYVSCVGEIVEQAQKSPMDEARVRKQMNKTGNTHYHFHDLTIEINGDIFMPVQKLNDLRRTALEELDRQACEQGKRVLTADGEASTIENKKKFTGDRVQLLKQTGFVAQENVTINGSVENLEQLEQLITFSEVSNIYLELETFEKTDLGKAIEIGHATGKNMLISLPYVYRNESANRFSKELLELLDKNADGFLVRNLESLQALRELSATDKCIRAVLDYNLYTFNNRAREQFDSLIVPGEFEIIYGALPVELTAAELAKLDNRLFELVGYGSIPMMVSAQCVNKTTGKCNHKEQNLFMKDRKNATFRIRNCCKYCYNLIYNENPLCLLDRKEEINELDPMAIRLIFTTETKEQVGQITDMAIQTLVHHKEATVPFEEYTRGHFFKGVE